MNDLLKQLGIDLPIIQAPMAGVSTPEMAAAVSNAGALGSIGVGATNAAGAREMIRATRALTTKSFNVNVFCHRPAKSDSDKEAAWLNLLAPRFHAVGAEPPKSLSEIYKSFLVDDQMLEVFLQEKPAVVSFHFGIAPPPAVQTLKRAGIVLLASATNRAEAKIAEAAGIDAIVAQGYEAGGHRGVFDENARDDEIGTLALTRLLVKEMKLPIIAAGGIMDGAGIAACLRLGASAAQLGTAFIACSESSADKYYRAALKSDAANHTVMTRAISGRPARCLTNLFTAIGEATEGKDVPDYPIAYDAGKALHIAAKKADEGGYGAQWAGQAAPLIREMPAAQLVGVLQSELDAAVRQSVEVAP